MDSALFGKRRKRPSPKTVKGWRQGVHEADMLTLDKSCIWVVAARGDTSQARNTTLLIHTVDFRCFSVLDKLLCLVLVISTENVAN